MLRVSRYTHVADIDHQTVLLYNVLTQGVAILPREVIDGSQGLASLSTEEIAALKENGIVVDADLDEKYLMRLWVREALTQKEYYTIVVAPTMDCNLRCTYCYEGDAKTSTYMTKEVADATMSWVEKELSSGKWRTVGFTLYGGEPLLHPDMCNYLGLALSEITSRYSLPWQASLITNGILLTRDMIARLTKGWAETKLGIQVTLDGPKDIHEARRRTLNGAPSFNQIIDNILEVRDIAYVTIRVNVDHGNLDSMDELLSLLARAGMADKSAGRRVALYFYPTHECGGDCDKLIFHDSEIVSRLVSLWQMAQSYGFETAAPFRFGVCIAQHGAGIVVGPTGDLYPCEGFLGEPGFVTGNVLTNELKPSYYEHLALNDWLDCVDTCDVFPLCVGGCRNRAYRAYGDWKARLCKYEVIRASCGEYFLFKYRREIEDYLAQQQLPQLPNRQSVPG